MQSDNQITTKAIAVWLICALFFMYEFMLRTVLGTFQLPITEDLHLTPVRFSIISSTAFQVAYGIMQIPVGIITSRFGLKRTLFCAVCICIVANLGFSLSHSFATATLFRSLMGLGSAFGFVCLLIAVYDWLPRKNAAFFIGLSQFIGTLGPMMAAGPLNYLSDANLIAWRGLFFSFAIAGIVIAALVFGIVDKNRHATGKFVILNRPSSIGENIWRLIRQPQIWAIGLFSASIYFSIEYLSENEGVLFLQTKGFSSSYASYMITLAWLGYAISCPLLGFLSDKLQKRKPIMILCTSATLVALLGIIYLPANPILTIGCFMMLGFGTSGQSIGFAVMAEHCKETYLAVGLGLNNAMIMTFAAISAPLIGLVLSHNMTSHQATLAALQHTFLLLIPLTLIALFCSVFIIPETFCKMLRVNTPLKPRSAKNCA